MRYVDRPEWNSNCWQDTASLDLLEGSSMVETT